MPNHFHIFIRTRTEAEQEAYWREQICLFSENRQISPFKLTPPSRVFNNMFIAYARAFNKATDRTGVLFETPFQRKPVNDDAYALSLVCYIHRNPQRHGIISDFRQWQWSSFSAFLSDKPTRLQREIVLEWFGGLGAFLDAHETAVDEAISEWFNLEK